MYSAIEYPTYPTVHCQRQSTAGYQVGCPIRKSPDQSLFAAPRSLSQRTTSFIASYRQGIHQTPFMRLIRSGRRQTACRRPRTLSGGTATPSAGRGPVRPVSVSEYGPPSGDPARAGPHRRPVFSLSSRCQGSPAAGKTGQKVQTNGRDMRRHRPADGGDAPGGACRDRTGDLMLAKHALSQLS
jgi:hypothetical protein